MPTLARSPPTAPHQQLNNNSQYNPNSSSSSAGPAFPTPALPSQPGAPGRGYAPPPQGRPEQPRYGSYAPASQYGSGDARFPTGAAASAQHLSPYPTYGGTNAAPAHNANAPTAFPDPYDRPRTRSSSGLNSAPRTAANANTTGRRRTSSHVPSTPRPAVPRAPATSAGPSSSSGGQHPSDDCPACHRELEQAMAASRASAEEEAARRQREAAEEEEERIRALHASEVEDRARRQEQEEEELRKVMEESMRDEQAARQSRETEQAVMEESRREAERAKERQRAEERELLNQSRLDSERAERKREEERKRMEEMEQAVLAESRRQQEEEWRRRDSEEREFLENLERARNQSASGSGAGPGAGAGAAGEGEVRSQSAEDEAYELAVRMSVASVSRITYPALPVQASSPKPGPSTTNRRRPLPATPGSAPPEAQQDASSEAFARRKQAELEAHYEQDPFRDPEGWVHEGPPAYEEAVVGSSTPPQPQPQPQPPPQSQASADSGPSHSGPSSASGSGHATPTTNRPAELRTSNSQTSIHPSPISTPGIEQGHGGGSASGSPVVAVGGFAEAIGGGEGPSPILSPSSIMGNEPELPTSAQAQTQTQSAARRFSAASSSSRPNTMDSAIRRSTSSRSELSTAPTSASGESSTNTATTTGSRAGTQRLPGVDFGYASMPFANDLYPAPQAREPTSKSKAGFPTVVQLSLPAKGAGVLGGSSGGSTTHAAAERGSYFVIRAHSWRSLLRAMAWHGNSRVEAGPQEVADAASAAAVMRAKGKRTDGGCHLLVEIEFVTPTTTTMSAGFGIGDYARTLGGGGGGTHHAPAHVALCLSLVRPSLPNSAESAIRKRESRNLDAIYSGRGSARRVIGLPRESPALPMLLVKLAQHLHRAHAFSAQCPSTGSVARHSPRDLHHAIERHDQDYLAKRRANADGNQGSSSSGQSPGHGGWSSNSLGGGGGGGSGAGNGQHGPSSEHDLVEMAVEDDDGSGEGSSGRLGRMKAKLSRKLHIRAGDGRVVDEDLATWITPFEMNEHG